MIRRLPVAPCPGPLEEYDLLFDDLFHARAQRDGYRRYLEGSPLPSGRNKTLTALSNTEPVTGSQRKEAQSLQWFLSESGWDHEVVNEEVALVVARSGHDRCPVGGRPWGRMGNDQPARPGSGRESESDLAPAGVEEVVRLYRLRMWVEQSYKQVNHALGWSD